MSVPEPTHVTNFIKNIVEEDMASNKWGGRVVTRFPPEPNGYLHIGHAKSICLNFGLARDYGGVCHLRFDDTNPAKEEQEYIDSIQQDVRWLGFEWNEKLFYASDYFQALHDHAVTLIQRGLAYVDDQSAEQIRATRGTLTQPGQDSPNRGRSVEENLELFAGMVRGDYPEGSRVLRAKIDMAHPNLHMRDPTLYRIRKVAHHRTGEQWLIYPMYDYTHCVSDSIEGITHSICTLEFEDNRILYDWFLDTLGLYHPQQIEFARLNLEYTVMSKRKLLTMVNEGLVDGWNDPRMPTISGLRRRGFTPESLRLFCDRIGVGRKAAWIGMDVLEKALRDDLNTKAPRVMGVLDPLKVVIENYPEGQVETLSAPYFPDDPPAMGYREVPFTRELYIERDDFMEDPPKKYWRLAPGREVRLRWAYFITCTEVVKDPATGRILEVRCTYDPATKGGNAPDGRSPKGTIHWVSAPSALRAQVRLYDRLMSVPRPDSEEGDFKRFLNPDSLITLNDCALEPSLAEAQPGGRFQFERKGYFYLEPESSTPGKPVFNRIATLRDTWAKIVEGGKKK